MELKNIIFKKENQIGFITLNRPDVYNALNHGLLTELGEVLEEIKKDSGIGALIITGAGEKAFVSGADINELLTLNTVSGWENSRYYQSILNQLERLESLPLPRLTGIALEGD